MCNAENAKRAVYTAVLPQIRALLDKEAGLTANLANVSAVLMQAFDWHWVGFYLVRDGGLVLGPFQGPPACTRIAYGRGVCGQAWAAAKTMVVDDVDKHPDHIACSALSRSEIVVPLFDRAGRVWAVLDADAATTAAFDGCDAEYLEQAVQLLQDFAP